MVASKCLLFEVRPGKSSGVMTGSQIEFPLRVAVCAWCKSQTSDGGPAVIADGICLRHFKKLKLGMLEKLPKRAAHSVRGKTPNLENSALPF